MDRHIRKEKWGHQGVCNPVKTMSLSEEEFRTNMRGGKTTGGQREKAAMYDLAEFAVYMKLTKRCKSTVKVKVLVTQSHPTFWMPWTVASVQARTLEWVTIPFSRGTSQPRN